MTEEIVQSICLDVMFLIEEEQGSGSHIINKGKIDN